MNSYTIYQMLRIIEDEPSKNAKIAFLEEFLEDSEFLRVIKAAYDPFITYGTVQIKLPLCGNGDFKESTYTVLDRLASRELTGHNAQDAITKELSSLNGESQLLFKHILNKDLRGGFNTKSINKAMPGLIPEVLYMRCSLPKEVKIKNFDWQNGVFSQEKLDGMFARINYNRGEIIVSTRKGKIFDPELFQELRRAFIEVAAPGYQYHGELQVVRNSKILNRKTSNGVLNHLLSGKGILADNEAVIFTFWDLVPLDFISDVTKWTTPYTDRYGFLQIIQHPLIRLANTKIVYTFEAAKAHFEEVHSNGGEGTIFKDPTTPWKNGTSRLQVKMKAEKEVEMLVTGFTEGKGKFEGTLGSMTCESSDGGLVVNISGFTDEERDEIWNNQNEWLNKIVTVRYNEVIDSKDKETFSLFSPRFVERRLDKVEADTTNYILKV